TVYLAHDLKHARDVAIKVLHPDLGAALGGERFLSEIRTTARLQHPHILPLLDSGDADGLLYYVMPLVTGETLRARLERERQLPIPAAVRIAREVASALDYAHRQGVIHRDIKPENILLHDGQAIVADFGIALAVQSAGGQRMTQTGLSLGTPQYMSPEQAMGERSIDARSDLYALAAVTYEMLTGDPPFTGSSVQAIVAKVLSAQPELPSLTRKAVTPAIEAAVLRGLEKLPADRFDSAAEFATALARESTVPTTAARPVPTTPPAPRRRLFAVGALALVAGIVGGWFAHARTGVDGPATTPRPLRLTHAGQVGCAAIAPGGAQFALVDGRFDEETYCSGSLLVRPLPTGRDQLIARVERVETLRWSPTGDALIIAGQPEGKARGLWVFPTNGAGSPRLLATGPHAAVGFIDGGHVYLVATPRRAAGDQATLPVLRVLDATSGAVTDSIRLPRPGPGEVVASASGRWFSYSSGAISGFHYIVSRAGAVVDSMADAERTVTWVGDSAIAYTRQSDWRPGDVMVRRINPSTGRCEGEPTVVLAGVPQGGSLSADAVTGKLMWIVRAVTDELHVTALPRATSSRFLTRSLNAYLGNPVLSPDGRRVAYTRQDALGSNAYVMPVDGGAETAISSDTAAATALYWPTAQHLVRVTTDGMLLSYDLATGRSRRYAPPPGEVLGAAAGNSWFFFTPGALLPIVRDSLLQAPRELSNPPGLSGRSGGALSMDGTTVLRIAATADGRDAFTTYNFPTSRWSALTPLDTVAALPVSVSNDGTAYFTRFNGRTEIWRARPGGPLALYATLPVHCYAHSVAVSDDGSLAACNVTTNIPDAWVVELPPMRR
ncbi:MAG: serine/threonine-protein kinase, partial [Gemmatimonadetes bacterium]|nr:serine/threonine-protein kinase [Gemmatimonadota bacterium]